MRPHLTQTVIDTVSNLSEKETVFISGWHAPIEKEIHKVLVNHGKPHIHAGAKSIHKLACELVEDKVLFLTHCSEKVHRITRENALRRNQIICELSEQLLIPWLDPRGKTHEIVKDVCADIPVFVFDSHYNQELIQSGAKSISELQVM
ncbi:MAG TPA: hypothetical protein VKA68_05340 [bacterium]|nr:hypothetical protein [bacterium]